MVQSTVVYSWGVSSKRFSQSGSCNDSAILAKTNKFMDEVAKKSGIKMPCWRRALAGVIAILCIATFIFIVSSPSTLINISVWLYIFSIICIIACCFSTFFIGCGGSRGYYKQRQRNVERYLAKHQKDILATLPRWRLSWAFKIGSQTRKVTVRTKNGGSRVENRTSYWLEGTVTFSGHSSNNHSSPPPQQPAGRELDNAPRGVGYLAELNRANQNTNQNEINRPMPGLIPLPQQNRPLPPVLQPRANIQPSPVPFVPNEVPQAYNFNTGRAQIYRHYDNDKGKSIPPIDNIHLEKDKEYSKRYPAAPFNNIDLD